MIELAETLTVVRCLLLFGVTLIIGSYHQPSARYRACVSIVAAFVAGSCFGVSMYTLTSLASGQFEPCAGAEILLIVLVLLAVIALARVRGNLAQLIKWSAR